MSRAENLISRTEDKVTVKLNLLAPHPSNRRCSPFGSHTRSVALIFVARVVVSLIFLVAFISRFGL